MKYRQLEFIRGAAALVVLINHLIGNLPAFTEDRPLLLTAIGAWGTEAVIVFFVLSGIVINHIQTQRPQSRTEFIKKRALRILPIYYLCVLLAVVIDYCTGVPLKFEQLAGTLFFVATTQGALTFPVTTIIVVWSLSYEVFFYLTFSLSIGSNQKKIIGLWFLVSLICCFLYYFEKENIVYAYFLNMFSFSALWLLGYYIYEFKDYLRTDFATAVFALSLIPITNRLQLSREYYNIGIFLCIAILTVPMFLLALNQNSDDTRAKKYYISILHYLPIYIIMVILSVTISKSLWISKVLYGAVPALSLIFLVPRICRFSKNALRKLEPFILFSGKISFALYLVHVPMIYLFGRLWPESKFVNCFLIVVTTFAVSSYLELFYQKYWVALTSKKNHNYPKEDSHVEQNP